MRSFEFHVNDSEGYWGDVRQNAETKEEAAALCRKWLDAEEVQPNGSVEIDYTLTLFKVGPVETDEEHTCADDTTEEEL